MTSAPAGDAMNGGALVATMDGGAAAGELRMLD